MRKLFFLVLACALIATATRAQSLPYNANYSSNFKIGTHDLSSMVLKLYKEYEANDFKNESWFADTVMVILPNGQVLQGKETVLNTFKEARRSDGDTKFEFDAILPAISVDRKENWVCLWGNSTTGQGKSEFQAIWRINKDRKVDFIKLFTAQATQQ
ncbi:MAG: hypothetical protein JNK79_08615 [Chitinophagaceae bacterium]|nr:hypothetical protein [Chitinophagaceae bacterium]